MVMAYRGNREHRRGQRGDREQVVARAKRAVAVWNKFVSTAVGADDRCECGHCYNSREDPVGKLFVCGWANDAFGDDLFEVARAMDDGDEGLVACGLLELVYFVYERFINGGLVKG